MKWIVQQVSITVKNYSNMSYILKPIYGIQLRLEYLASPHKPEIIAMVGVSGSGKTTLATEMIKTDNKFVRVSRDDIRSMLFGLKEEDHSDYYKRTNLRHLEDVITAVEDNIIMAALHTGRSVVVDATHLKMKYIERLKKFGHPITLCIMTTPLGDCIQNDFDREGRHVGGDNIARQHNDFRKLMNHLNIVV